MKIKFSLVAAVLATALCAAGQSASAADKKTSSAMDKTFIMKAATGGMMEVELGKVAAAKGGSDEVKDFGNRMVKDHGKANDQLKEVASKMSVEVPATLDATHQAMVDKMSAMSGPAFDKAYVAAMIKDHQKDIAEFEKAEGQVKNEDLKEFIKDTVPTMKEHLEMIKKFDQAKKS